MLSKIWDKNLSYSVNQQFTRVEREGFQKDLRGVQIVLVEKIFVSFLPKKSSPASQTLYSTIYL